MTNKASAEPYNIDQSQHGRHLTILILTIHSMEDIFRLCDLEPQHCQEVFMALDYSTAAEKSKLNLNLIDLFYVFGHYSVVFTTVL